MTRFPIHRADYHPVCARLDPAHEPFHVHLLSRLQDGLGHRVEQLADDAEVELQLAYFDQHCSLLNRALRLKEITRHS